MPPSQPSLVGKMRLDPSGDHARRRVAIAVLVELGVRREGRSVAAAGVHDDDGIGPVVPVAVGDARAVGRPGRVSGGPRPIGQLAQVGAVRPDA